MADQRDSATLGAPTTGAQKDSSNFTWLGDYKERGGWSKIEDPRDKRLQVSEVERKLLRKQGIDEFNLGIKRKSMIRYLTVIVDFSSAARKQEMRPNRAVVIKSYLSVSRNNVLTPSLVIHYGFFRLEPFELAIICCYLQRASSPSVRFY